MPVIFSSFLRFSSSLQYFAHSRPRASTAASPGLIVLVHSEESVPAALASATTMTIAVA
jgi:hypothetical protein